MSGPPISILLVDDDPKNLLALEAILESADHRLVKAQTADEALLALMREDYAAIVLDVQMPDLNGIELARLIKQTVLWLPPAGSAFRGTPKKFVQS